jgi:hypothetical protein
MAQDAHPDGRRYKEGRVGPAAADRATALRELIAMKQWTGCCQPIAFRLDPATSARLIAEFGDGQPATNILREVPKTPRNHRRRGIELKGVATLALHGVIGNAGLR